MPSIAPLSSSRISVHSKMLKDFRIAHVSQVLDQAEGGFKVRIYSTSDMQMTRETTGFSVLVVILSGDSFLGPTGSGESAIKNTKSYCQGVRRY